MQIMCLRAHSELNLCTGALCRQGEKSLRSGIRKMFYHPQWFSALLSNAMLGRGVSLEHEDWGDKRRGQKQISIAQ